MIKESEILNLLGEEIPDINTELEKLAHSGNIYKSIQCFADFTKELILSGNLKAVKHCIKLADKMLAEGTSTVKNAIENVYLFSLSTAIDLTAPVKEMLTGPLKKEYHRQTTRCGI
jgi:hypothetical protein